MLGAMQDWELRVSSLVDHAAREHGARPVVTRWVDGTVTRTDWAGIRAAAMRMAHALRRLGLAPHDRVATLALNHHRHLVAWYGVTGAGGVLHTLNPRLFDDQLEYIVNHAEDRVLIYDAQFQPLVNRMRERWTTVEHYICFDSGAHAPHFEDWIAREKGDGEWVDGGEREPCMLCYTSGTTGHPKGVLYEHRSTLLHALTSLQPALLGLDCRSVVLPVVPLFHAAGWGLPWSCAAAGAAMVFVQGNDPAALCAMLRDERVSDCAGVPTVWLSMFQHLDATGETLPDLRQALVGGSAMPRAAVERLMRRPMPGA